MKILHYSKTKKKARDKFITALFKTRNYVFASKTKLYIDYGHEKHYYFSEKAAPILNGYVFDKIFIDEIDEPENFETIRLSGYQRGKTPDSEIMYE